MMPASRADLHTHTTASDGVYSPRELIEKAIEAGISCISITDHDTLSAYNDPFLREQTLIRIITGIEFSCEINEREVHLLGYFIDPDNTKLNEFLTFSKEERLRRGERIVQKLKELGFQLDFNEIKESANGAPITRPHIADAMVKKGIVKNFYEAFSQYLGKGCPAYVKKTTVSPREVINIIDSAGGLSFIAHPGTIPDEYLMRLIKDGMQGIEVVHPSHTPFQQTYFNKIAASYFLLLSGGSDFHGGKRNDEQNLGRYTIPLSMVESMTHRLQKRPKI